MELKDSKSWQNLEKALELECKAYCEYFFFGAQAAKDGYTQISEIFNETASNELHHAKLLYKKLHDGAMPHTMDNLKSAKASEEAEGIEAYAQFAQDARDEGFEDLANWFEMLSKIEITHEQRFNQLIDRVNNNEVFHREEEKVWVCTVCGYIHIGTEPPEKCPVCDHPQGHFEIRAENY
jgi:rubrerythrin